MLLVLPRCRGCRLGCLEVSQEPVHDGACLGVVGEAFADHAGRQVDGEAAHLGAERNERRLALRLDLGGGACADARRLRRRLLLELGEDVLAVSTCLLADAAGFGTGLGQLRRVLLQGRLSLTLRVIRLGDVALDCLRALVEQLLHARECDLEEEEQHHQEADR
jgi:hypothetical protein